MNEKELIALSDLNREDNIKYISSEAQGIAITLNSDKYAPTLCKLERAYICGRRKSEEQIEQLEKENAELKADNDARKFAMSMSEKVEKQLRGEIAELKEKLKPENCLKLLAKDGYIKFTSDQLIKAKEIMRIGIEGTKLEFLFAGRERPFAKKAKEMLNSFVEEAEQFLSEVEK